MCYTHPMESKATDPRDVFLLKILIYPDPILSMKCAPIEEITDDIRVLADRMSRTMIAAPGLGLAAPQVGKPIRLIIIDISCGEENVERDTVAMINPMILETSGEALDEEGCLSIPGIFTDTVRPERLRVEYTTLDGNRHELAAQGTLARCIAHEIDHLNGILFWDRLGKFKKDWLKLKFKRLGY